MSELFSDHDFDLRRLACILLVNTSNSMAGSSIKEVNEGIQSFKQAILNDSFAKRVVDVCLISFGDYAEVKVPFCPIECFEPPFLKADGMAAMNQATLLGLLELEKRKQMYMQCGMAYYRPMMFSLTDGYATDSNLEALTMYALTTSIGGNPKFFSLGVEKAEMSKLCRYTPTGTFFLKGYDFQSAFTWVEPCEMDISSIDDLPLPGEIITIDW